MSTQKIPFILIIFLTLFAFAIRVYRLTEPNHYYFDEVYHAVTAKAYADNNPAPYNPFSPSPKKDTAYDWLHPPLAKLIQAASIKIFGDVPLGWRLPSVIFGTAIIPATFVLANILFGPVVAIFASTTIAFENLTFVMSRITMNDVFLTFFVIVSFIFASLYVKKSTSEESEPASEVTGRTSHPDSAQAGERSQGFFVSSGKAGRTQNDNIKYLLLTSVFLGLALASKWPGLYAIAAVFVYLLWSTFRFSLPLSGVFKLLLLIVIPTLLYLASYGQFWLQGHSFRQFVDLHKQIWWYQNRHDLEHSYGTTPLFCVPKGLNGPKTWCPWALDFRGVYFSYEQYGSKAGYIYALGNPLIFWTGLVAVAYVIGKYVDERKKEYALILLGYFIFWLPWIFSPRILFMYHYLPSIPFLTIALGVAISDIYKNRFKFVAIVILAAFIATFFYLYPISSGWPIGVAAIDNYMWLKTWR